MTAKDPADAVREALEPNEAALVLLTLANNAGTPRIAKALNECAEVIAALTARVAASERDAGRYRWLISQHWVQFEADWRLGIDPETVDGYGPAIDARNQEHKP